MRATISLPIYRKTVHISSHQFFWKLLQLSDLQVVWHHLQQLGLHVVLRDGQLGVALDPVPHHPHRPGPSAVGTNVAPVVEGGRVVPTAHARNGFDIRQGIRIRNSPQCTGNRLFRLAFADPQYIHIFTTSKHFFKCLSNSAPDPKVHPGGEQVDHVHQAAPVVAVPLHGGSDLKFAIHRCKIVG